MAKKNILFVEQNIDGTVGGSYYSLFYLVTGINKSNYNPIVVFYNNNELISEFSKLSIRVIVLKRNIPFVISELKINIFILTSVINFFILVSQKIINFIWTFAIPTINSIKFLKRENIDLTHLNNSIIYNHSWMLACFLMGIPCITHERGINNNFSILSKFFGSKLKSIICISDAVKKNMINYGIKSSNLVTIYNGIDPDNIRIVKAPERIRKLQGFSNNEILVGIVGNIKEWKGQETVIKAMDIVREKISNIKCLLVGDTAESDRYYHDKLSDLVKKENLESIIVFAGYQKNVADYINAMDVVIHASILPEPFGRVVIEAMALKKPVIGTRAGAIPEIIVDGSTGKLYKPGDYKELSKCIISILMDKENMQKFGEDGFLRLINHFHIKQNIKRTEEIYTNIFRKDNS